MVLKCSCFRPGSGAVKAAENIASMATSAAAESTSNAVWAAHKAGQLGFAFSGGGFLLPYFCGVAHQLGHMGLLKPGITPVSGSSAGSILAACITAGVSMQLVLDQTLSALADCRKHGVKGRLSSAVVVPLLNQLPHDAHTRCKGVAHIGITRVWPAPRSQVVSDFHSREDLMSAVLASCYLPMVSDGRFTTKFRGQSVMDGGFTAFMHALPLSTAAHTVKITCVPQSTLPHLPLFNRKVLQGLAIAPDFFAAWPHSVQQTFKLSLEPGPDSFYMAVVERGQDDVLAWAQRAGIMDKLELQPQQDARAASLQGPAPDLTPPLLGPAPQTPLPLQTAYADAVTGRTSRDAEAAAAGEIGAAHKQEPRRCEHHGSSSTTGNPQQAQGTSADPRHKRILSTAVKQQHQ